MEVYSIVINSFLLSTFGFVTCQDYYEMRHAQHFRTQDASQIREIPKKFEVSGDNIKDQFMKYIDNIQHIAQKENVTLIYKVKIDIMKPVSKTTKKSVLPKKNKSKKYNIPLKKKNMRLSNFEIIMKKLADMNVQKLDSNPIITTETGALKLSTTSKLPVMKYKPIISRVRPKYSKKNGVKPIKTHEITLSSRKKKRSI